MKATDAYRKINNSPLKGIILYYTERISKAIGETNIGSVIAKIQTGKTPPKAISKYYESSDVNWFKPSDIGYSKYLVDAEEQFSLIAVKEKKATIYPKETLLMIGIGGGVGRVSILKEEGSSNQQITGLTFKENIFPEYAYYYYLVREDYIKSFAKSMSFPILNQESIKGLKFSYPEIEEQKEFVRFIDNCWESFLAQKIPNFDEYQIDFDLKEYSLKQFKSVNLIDSFNENIKNETKLLLLLRQSIIKDAIYGSLTASWRENNKEKESAEELYKLIKKDKEKKIKEKKIKKEKELDPITEDEIPHEIPENWVWCRLGELYSTTSGGTPLRANANYWFGDITWYKSGELTDSYLDAESEEKISEIGLKESSATLFPKGTLLIAMYGATAGKLSILNRDASTNQAICGFFYNEFIETKYLFYFLMAQRAKMISDSWGMSQPNISQTYLRNFVFALPPREEQKAIIEKVEVLMSKCLKLSEEIETLDKHGKTLMKAMFNETFETNKILENEIDK